MEGPPPRLHARASSRATVVEVHDRLYLRVDARGRWTAFAEGGVLFRRTLDGRVLRPRGRGFETLEAEAADVVDAWIVRRAGELMEALAETPPERLDLLGEKEAILERLQHAACGQAPSPTDERAQFEAAYPEPVPILPPHRYRDVVVLPATGCPNHRCRFCAFYRDRPFRVLSPGAFREHVRAVRDLFGDALAERDGVFLGSASALTLPDEVLLDRLGIVGGLLGPLRRKVASFHDPDRGVVRTPAAWARLREAGLVEVTLGLETALPSLREDVGKSPDLDRFTDQVRAQKEGGLGVSLTVLVGLGGTEVRHLHRTATVARIADLPLDARDRIYLSPYRSDRPAEASLAEGALVAEVASFRRALGEITAARVGDYRVERFAWFA